MNIDIYGPLDTPRTKAKLIDGSRVPRKVFWDMAETAMQGLSQACGDRKLKLLNSALKASGRTSRRIVMWSVGPGKGKA